MSSDEGLPKMGDLLGLLKDEPIFMGCEECQELKKRVAELEQENRQLVEIGNGFSADLANAKHHRSLYGETVCQLQAELAELRSQRLSAMVLVYQPELTHSVWQEYAGMVNEETGEEIPRSHKELIEDLRAGVVRGDWVAWRLARIEKEVIGNE